MIPEKLKSILLLALSIGFFGEITIKFQGGKITQIERKESIKI